jgi:hypothetical protein
LQSPDATIDFAAFSYNDPNELPPQDIGNAIREAQRVLTEGGYFFFSRHNITRAQEFFKFALPRNPRRTLRAVRLTLALHRLNPNWRTLATKD